MDEDYKSLMIANNTCDADITFYVYLEWDIICWLSYSSKIIKPGERYYHRSKSGFQYKIVARFNLENKRKTKTVVEVEKWKEDKAIIVLDSLDITEGKLDDFPQEKQICLQNGNKERDVASYNGGRNLYEILKLDIRTVRKMSEQEQNKTIRKAFHKEIRRWHPDHHHGDEEIAREVIMAYDVLGNPETRAAYNNEADYDRGWLSVSRFKAIFWPDCHTDEQKWAYRQRMIMFGLSFGLAIGGIAVIIGTGGLAAPALMTVGAVLGGGIAGAGAYSLPETVNREAVVDGCDTKKWVKKAAIASVVGAVIGGASVGAGIAAGVTYFGREAFGPAAVSVVRRIAVKAGTSATERVVNDFLGKKFVDGQDVTCKQILRHANGGHVKYICDGLYCSKMVVTYNLDNEECTEEVSGSGNSIDIPAQARQIKVRFQVARPFWGDVLKYDRFGHRWCKPYEAHVFQFEFPPIRTFTISGSLHYEAVMKVSNEHYDETEDM